MTRVKKIVVPMLTVRVVAGEYYQSTRPGLPARHVRVVCVHKSGRENQPIATLIEVTRSGSAKRDAVEYYSHLTFIGGAWRLALGYVSVAL